MAIEASAGERADQAQLVVAEGAPASRCPAWRTPSRPSSPMTGAATTECSSRSRSRPGRPRRSARTGVARGSRPTRPAGPPGSRGPRARSAGRRRRRRELHRHDPVVERRSSAGRSRATRPTAARGGRGGPARRPGGGRVSWTIRSRMSPGSVAQRPSRLPISRSARSSSARRASVSRERPSSSIRRARPSATAAWPAIVSSRTACVRGRRRPPGRPDGDRAERPLVADQRRGDDAADALAPRVRVGSVAVDECSSVR